MGGVGGAIEEMGRGMREEVAFRANVVIGPAETSAEIIERSAEAGSELREGCTCFTWKKTLGRVNKRGSGVKDAI